MSISDYNSADNSAEISDYNSADNSAEISDYNSADNSAEISDYNSADNSAEISDYNSAECKESCYKCSKGGPSFSLALVMYTRLQLLNDYIGQKIAFV